MMKAKRAKPWTKEHREKYTAWVTSIAGQRARLANGQRMCGTEKPYTKKAKKSPTYADISWAAGFIEGEGSFHLTAKGGQVSACQVNPGPLDKLLELFGGSIHTEKRVQNKPNWKPRLNWRTSGARARGIALTLYPLMSSRRQEQIRRMFGYA